MHTSHRQNEQPKAAIFRIHTTTNARPPRENSDAFNFGMLLVASTLLRADSHLSSRVLCSSRVSSFVKWLRSVRCLFFYHWHLVDLVITRFPLEAIKIWSYWFKGRRPRFIEVACPLMIIHFGRYLTLLTICTKTYNTYVYSSNKNTSIFGRNRSVAIPFIRSAPSGSCCHSNSPSGCHSEIVWLMA